MRLVASMFAIGSCVAALVFGASSRTAAMEDLVGTWRLVELTNYRDGEKVQPFGPNPLGYFVYTPSGHVSIHIMHSPPPYSFEDLDMSEKQRREVGQRSYMGYFGTFEVDPVRSVIIHRVEGGTVLSYIGTDQIRPFRLEDDVLIIGEDEEWIRVLERVR